jgi:hypothetical protein
MIFAGKYSSSANTAKPANKRRRKDNADVKEAPSARRTAIRGKYAPP